MRQRGRCYCGAPLDMTPCDCTMESVADDMRAETERRARQDRAQQTLDITPVTEKVRAILNGETAA